MISPGQTHGKDDAFEGIFPLKLVLVLGRTCLGQDAYTDIALNLNIYIHY